MENEYLHMLARVVLPAQILEYFTIVGVEQTSTEIHVSLDEKIGVSGYFWLLDAANQE